MLAISVGLGLAAWAGGNLLIGDHDVGSRAALDGRDPPPRAQSTLPYRAVPPAAAELAAGRNALATLRRHFGVSRRLFSKYADTPGYAGVWAVAQVIDGATALSKPHGSGVPRRLVRELVGGLRIYWDGSAATPGYDKGVRAPLGSGGHKFYDDNALVGLSLVRAYELTGDKNMLSRAQRVFDFEKTGWDRNPAHPFPGGVFWQQVRHAHDRNTVSTAGAAQLGFYLNLLTGNSEDLSWAIRMYDWVDTTMRSPSGLYWDHVGLGGRFDKTFWSYNQGLMIGDSLLRFRATGDPTSLQRAESIAATALARYRGGRSLARQRPIINSIFFANLLNLEEVAPDPAYLDAAKTYAAYLRRKVSRRTGLLQVNPRPFLLDQAALVQVDAYIVLASRGIPVG
jgi:hypothetical protein